MQSKNIFFIYNNRNFVTSINILSCGIFKLYYELKNGISIGWMGFDNILSMIKSTFDESLNLANKYETVFSETKISQLNSLPLELEKSLTNVFTKYYKKEITFPNFIYPPSMSEILNPFQPTYLNNFGNYTNNGTTLGKIYNDFNNKINSIIKAINQIKKNSKNIHDNLGSIQNIFNRTSSLFLKMKNDVDDISTKILNPWSDFVYINLNI
jgi:hypothetical protein